MTIREVYDWLDRLAPFDTQEDFDNSGLLLGHPDAPVRRVFFTLDVTDACLAEAEKFGADLVISHHPLIFHPRTHLRENDHEAALLCRMIRRGMGLISAHTNLDQADGGINDTLVHLLGLEPLPEHTRYVRAGRLPQPMTCVELEAYVSERLHTPVRVMGSGNVPLIQTLAVSSGAGSDFWPEAAALGAQAFLSGEVRHHHALAMNAQGMIALEAGHDATEKPGILALADALQSWFHAVEYDAIVCKSEADTYTLSPSL